jgi:hypothetical protein
LHTPKKITELFAWICTEPDGGDGIPAMHHNGTALPLVGSDGARIESFRPYAEDLARRGLPVRLARFSTMEVLEEIAPATPREGRQ